MKLLKSLLFLLFLASCSLAEDAYETESRFEINAADIVAPCDPTIVELAITSNRAWSVMIPQEYDWFHPDRLEQTNLSGITKTTVLRLEFDQNGNPQERTGAFDIFSEGYRQTIRVRQNSNHVFE